MNSGVVNPGDERTRSNAAGAGARPEEMRRRNRTAVLRLLHLNGPCVRSMLTTELGVNRSSTKAVVDELTEDGLLVEQASTSRGGLGRPSKLVSPRAEAVVVLALDVGGDRIQAALVGLGGEILARRRRPIVPAGVDPAALLASTVDLVRGMVAERVVRAAGVSVPGIVRRADGYVHESSELAWRDVPFGDMVAQALEAPVQVAKRAEAGAVAELLRGAGRRATDMVYLAGATELTAGIVVGGSVLSSSSGYMGELGHMSLDPAGPPCICGMRGCWMNEAGRAALSAALGLSRYTDEDAVRRALAAVVRGDVGLSAGLEAYGGWLATGLLIVVRMLAPQIVVLGGLLGLLPNQVLDHVTEVLTQRDVRGRVVIPVRVVRSALDADVHLIGAAELAFGPVLDSL